MTAYTFNQLFDFTRTTSATFVGSNGLIQTTPASVNLLLQTQQFDNAAWVNSIGGTGTNPTISANTGVAPDGTNTADRLQFTLGGGTTLADLTRRIQNYNTLASTTYTFSVYLRSFDGSSTYNMHLVAADGVTNSIVVTGAWQRFTLTGSRAVTAIVGYAIGLRGGLSPANSNTADVLAWGAQLEVGSVATTYTRNNAGVYPARFDYDPVTLAPKGILIEEQRTNLFQRSEEFDNASWTKVTVTATANTMTSPDGTVNADSMTANGGSAQHFVNQTQSFTSGTAYTLSVFAKKDTLNGLQLTFGSGAFGTLPYANFDLNAGTSFTSNCTATLTNFGNGWYRCTMTATANGTTTAGAVIGLARDNTESRLPIFNSDGNGIYVYGAQLEAGAFPTSYIPTVASQVTRSGDACNIVAPMFAPWYNQSEGTFVIYADTGAATSLILRQSLVASDGTASNYIRAYTYDGRWASSVVTGGATQADLYASGNTAVVNVPAKYAVAVQANNFAGCLNGGTVTTDTSGTMPTVSQIFLGQFAPAGNVLNGHIRSIKYFPFRASNNQLQALTT
jgi:hypothetical protein